MWFGAAIGCVCFAGCGPDWDALLRFEPSPEAGASRDASDEPLGFREGSRGGPARDVDAAARDAGPDGGRRVPKAR